MSGPKVWQWLWIVGFIPWVIVNNFAFKYIDNDWLFGYWDVTLNQFLEFLFPAQAEGLMSAPALLAIFVAYLVPYIVLYYVADWLWQAVLSITAGFRQK